MGHAIVSACVCVLVAGKPDVEAQPEQPSKETQPEVPHEDVQQEKPIEEAQPGSSKEDVQPEKTVEDTSSAEKIVVDEAPNDKVDDADDVVFLAVRLYLPLWIGLKIFSRVEC